jgi:hypothetical protein
MLIVHYEYRDFKIVMSWGLYWVICEDGKYLHLTNSFGDARAWIDAELDKDNL